VLTSQKTVLLSIIIWCILEIYRSRFGSGNCLQTQVLISVSREPQLLEGLIRYLLWESDYCFDVIVEGNVLDPMSKKVLQILQNEGFVTTVVKDKQPDLVFIL
jgi:hypothetical protein